MRLTFRGRGGVKEGVKEHRIEFGNGLYDARLTVVRGGDCEHAREPSSGSRKVGGTAS